ncbi:hypothetical protein JQX13_21040 [Archangium violaceum]|nr:hypothetical protein JQX13_21040 [Archangium violaceum]
MRVASGYLDGPGALRLREALHPGVTVEVLTSLSGCSRDAAQTLHGIRGLTLRATRSTAFHWKCALVETPDGRILWVGSANFTGKGTGGEGEMMLRLAGTALPRPLWKEVLEDFQRHFVAERTLQGEALLKAVQSLVEDRERLSSAERVLCERAAVIGNMPQKPTDAAQDAWFMIWKREEADPLLQQVLEEARSAHSKSHSFSVGELLSGERSSLRTGALVLALTQDTGLYSLSRILKCRAFMTQPEPRYFVVLEHLAPDVTAGEPGTAFRELEALRRAEGTPRIAPMRPEVVARVEGIFRRHAQLVAISALTDDTPVPAPHPWRARKLPA